MFLTKKQNTMKTYTKNFLTFHKSKRKSAVSCFKILKKQGQSPDKKNYRSFVIQEDAEC
jgi:hypothetical protein